MLRINHRMMAYALRHFKRLRAHLNRDRFEFRCAVYACLMFSGLASATTDILIVQSHSSEPYQQALSGFQSDLTAKKINADYQTLSVSNGSDASALSQLMQNYQPKLLLTLGTPATRISMAQISKIPIVASLILETEELRRNTNATGVGLNFPASLQWLWLRRLLPDARQIAVLYDPNSGSGIFQALQKQAQAEGISLIQAPAADAKDLPVLMQTLPSQLDALWAVDGAAAYSTAAVRELLLYSFRNRVPLIGLSAQWVKAGALYALDWDYSDLGKQAAELAKDILLKGTPPASLPPQTPRKARLVLNMKTADHMKLQISDRWLPEMAEVFE